MSAGKRRAGKEGEKQEMGKKMVSEVRSKGQGLAMADASFFSSLL